MQEQAFFRHVAQRLGRLEVLDTPPARVGIGAPGFWQGYELSYRDRTEKFRDELKKLGGNVNLYATMEELQQGLLDLLTQLSPSAVGTWGEPFLAEYGLEKVLESYSLVTWNPESGASLIGRTAALDVGITGCDYAVADTGSLVLLATKEQGRSMSLLPAIHIALVKESRIKTRVGEVFAELEQRHPDKVQQPSSINFISGPSRSSDIENDLSIGVHGPAAIFALVLLDGDNHA